METAGIIDGLLSESPDCAECVIPQIAELLRIHGISATLMVRGNYLYIATDVGLIIWNIAARCIQAYIMI